ncbi:MAG: cysteine--tRNA ligase [Patescibacteria group bacterium]
MNQSKIKLYNTLSRKKEEFTPINELEVRMYTCGPTVYNYTHIGNLRSYIFADILCRTLKYSGLKVKQVINITDIGHLSSDADSGDDKMTKGLLREGKELSLKNMRELAEFYTESFKEDLKILNVEKPNGMYFASDYIKEDIDLIKKLEKKGYTYKTSDGIYFNISKMSDYGILSGGKKNWNKEGARIAENSEKKNPEDFALWKFNNEIGFKSPFGKGFPGWHIECSAMSMKFLGEQFDIHTGGIDLIPIHHTNEIAQSECATGKKPFVKFWMHSEHVDTGGERMAKSVGNFLKIQSLIEKGINPITYRFWLLMANYRTKVNFVWEALEGAETALKRLYRLYLNLGEEVGDINKNYQKKFKECLKDDLDTSKALALLWDLLKDLPADKESEKILNKDKKATILDFDKVLGLGFLNLKEEDIPKKITKLAEERELARKNKDWNTADEIREKISEMGYDTDDTSSGPRIRKV